MKKTYETKVINEGGRIGESYTPDRSFQVTIASPNQKQDGATNPEQLFAAGYAACFNGALGLAMKNAGTTGKSTVAVTVSMYSGGVGIFQLGAEIEGHIEGLPLEETEALLQEAHQICPYSKAVKGNIQVEIRAI